MRERSISREKIILILIMALGFALRFTGSTFGLPAPVFSDEPHHINIALYFGSGDLNPHFFKYPTLWMYALAALYGGIFIFWSGFGLLHSVRDFAALFIWNPTVFYLSARLLAGACSGVAVYFIYALCREFVSEDAALFGALAAAVSPPIIELSHNAKPDMMMVMFASIAWLYAMRFLLKGDDKNLWLASTATGLAGSSQYTAVFLVPLLFLAALARPDADTRTKFLKLIKAGFICGLFFFIGTPFSVFDFHSFLRDLHDQASYAGGSMAIRPELLGWRVFRHYTDLLGPLYTGALLMVLGLFRFGKISLRALLVTLVPMLIGASVFGTHNVQAGLINYLFCLCPAVYLIAAFAFDSLNIFPSTARWLLLIALLLPAAWQSADMDRQYLTKDTRTEAEHWIEKNIPSGTAILLDQAHAEPPLVMDKSQVARLYERTSELKHPRAIYYKRMLDSHPGGGYVIYRILRTPAELIALKSLTDWSQKASDWVDVEKGLDEARRLGVQYVVWTSRGVRRDNSPRLQKFLDELDRLELVKEFTPPTDMSPTLKIYRINSSEATNASVHPPVANR